LKLLAAIYRVRGPAFIDLPVEQLRVGHCQVTERRRGTALDHEFSMRHLADQGLQDVQLIGD
jgi:hypothetical protein